MRSDRREEKSIRRSVLYLHGGINSFLDMKDEVKCVYFFEILNIFLYAELILHISECLRFVPENCYKIMENYNIRL
ncbi:UNVERIFIED_CONTAM: hypothetical protein PYX00_008637 [Menopon gallinae]|uniref:Uncharacterized protein n=1 Tax=Menopon gallinae TaxID=328185 RepID=A0AAW2HQ95_9NEOP